MFLRRAIETQIENEQSHRIIIKVEKKIRIEGLLEYCHLSIAIYI